MHALRRVVGGLTSMLVLLKGLPRAYNKDLQEDKEAVFDTCRTMRGAIPIMAGVLATLKLNE
jgi:argininosuccinate lyase